MLLSLEPKNIWDFFCQISAIPRPSKHEEKIIAFLVDFATRRGLQYKIDKIGNVVILKEATSSSLSGKTIILQSHIDMVCEKLPSSNHDFFKDPIIPFFEDGWVKASGTTLGADNGIGIAAALAVLDSNDLTHCNIEALFTVDEETGLSGVMALEPDFVKGSMLLNLDSEDDGEFYVGCAGGIDTVGSLSFECEDVSADLFPFQLTISNLNGGHSGDDIGKGYHSANVILAKFLAHFNTVFPIQIAEIEGGNLRNAIARDAKIIFLTSKKFKESVRVEFNCFLAEIENDIKLFDPLCDITFGSVHSPLKTFTVDASRRLIDVMIGMPHGVIKWSERIEGLVQTSTNFASIKQHNNLIEITTSQRSSSKIEKNEIADKVSALFVKNGFSFAHENEYPGWESAHDSELITRAKASYLSTFGEYPKIKEIHAGLECGILSERYPHLEIISFGPSIRGAHSPSEKIEVNAVERFWLLLIKLLHDLS